MADFTSYVNKLPGDSSDPTKHFIIKSTWKIDCLHVEITQNAQAWTGVLQNSEMLTFCSFLETDLKSYLAEAKRALTTNGGAEHYFYSVHKNKFVWKKYSADTKIKMRHGEIELKENDFNEVVLSVLNDMISVNETLRKDLISTKEENNELSTKKSELIEKLNKYRIMKNEMEEELYGKFLVILNEKKDKIKLLQELLEQTGAEVDDLHELSDVLPPAQKKKVHAISDSENSDCSNNDFEQIESPNPERMCILPKRIKTSVKLATLDLPTTSYNKSPKIDDSQENVDLFCSTMDLLDEL